MIPHEKPRLIRVLEDLDLPEGQWVLSGSGVMCLHGIERDRPMGDVDIFLATRTWFRYYHEGLVGLLDPNTQNHPWKVFTTDPDDPDRRCDPPYLYKEMHGIEVNIFSSWRLRGIGDINASELIRDAEMVEGWPCASLEFLLSWKDEVGRAKDTKDIEVLKKHLERKKRHGN
jgi:hypothetical protein